MPRLAVTVRVRPVAVGTASVRTESSTAAATESASSGVASGSRIANSSPPRRASTSDSRRRLRSACATRTISSSPAEWPSVSLIVLKWSRSSTIAAPFGP